MSIIVTAAAATIDETIRRLALEQLIA